MKASHIVVLALAAIFGAIIVDARSDNIKHNFVPHHKNAYKGPSHLTSRNVVLKTAHLDTLKHPEFHFDEEHLQHTSSFFDATKHQYLVHVERTASSAEIYQMEKVIGVKFSAYLPHHTYLLYADYATAMKARNGPGVLWVGAFKPSHKLILDTFFSGDVNSQSIYITLVPEYLLPASERRTLANAQRIAAAWTAAVASSQVQGVAAIDAASPDRIVVSLANGADLEAVLRFFAERPESHWMEPGPVYRALNKFAARVVIDNDAAGDRSFTDNKGIDGTGQIVGLADSGLDYSICYFEDSSVAPPSDSVNATARKVVQYVVGTGGNMFDDPNGHGTYVAGTIAGNSTQSGDTNTNLNGVAPGAKLHFTDISSVEGVLNIPADETALFQSAAAAGAKIFVVTWGSGNTSFYTTQAQAIDQWIITQQTGLVIIAAGNSGFGQKVNNSRASLTNEAVSKNALVVGSCLSTLEGFLQGIAGDQQQDYIGYDALYGTQTLSDFSGRGPTADGRIKPDIVAPGESLNSATTAFCGVPTTAKGTSSAAAVAAGVAALLGQYLAAGYLPAGTPSFTGYYKDQPSAVMKALMIHSGQSLLLQATETGFTGLGYPGNGQGFGRIELDQILLFENSSLSLAVYSNRAGDLTHEVAKGASNRYCFTAHETTQYIKATLYWHDPPNSPSAGIAAVNNLDLVLIDTTGKEYRTNTADDGQFDQLNNVEQIVFKNPTPGIYVLYVYGAQVVGSNATQAYSLVLSSNNASVFTLCDNIGFPVCPLDCSNRGSCDPTYSYCICDEGAFGVDCSLTACPEDCNGNGICDYSTGECICSGSWSAPNCSAIVVDSTGNTTGSTIIYTTTSSGVPIAMFGGVVAAAFVVGALCSIVLGGFVAVKYLEHKRDQMAKKNTDEKGEQDRY